MDYAVYKKVEEESPVAVRVFKQSMHAHRAKREAQEYIRNLFFRAINCEYITNVQANDGNNSFEYDKQKTTIITEHIKFYIGEYKD
jgi:hypothetical protein